MEIIIDDRERAITDIIKSVDFPPTITYKIIIRSLNYDTHYESNIRILSDKVNTYSRIS